MERSEIPHDPRHLGVPSGASKIISDPMVRLTHTVHYLASRLALCPKGQKELPLEPRHLVVPLSASKTISESMVCRAQTMHLSCTDTNTISKWKEVRFHMTTSPRSSIRCVQNDCRAYGTFNANRIPILRLD